MGGVHCRMKLLFAVVQPLTEWLELFLITRVATAKISIIKFGIGSWVLNP